MDRVRTLDLITVAYRVLRHEIVFYPKVELIGEGTIVMVCPVLFGSVGWDLAAKEPSEKFLEVCTSDFLDRCIIPDLILTSLRVNGSRAHYLIVPPPHEKLTEVSVLTLRILENQLLPGRIVAEEVVVPPAIIPV
jgi:hypothetical protein